MKGVPVIRAWNDACRCGDLTIDRVRAIRDDPGRVWIEAGGRRVGMLDHARCSVAGVIEGCALDADLIERIDAEVRELLCDRSAVRMLAARAQSRAMLERKLLLRGHDRETVTRVCARWVERGAIDDARFAERAVRGELARRPAGRRLLEAKLAAKGVSGREARVAIDAGLADRDELEDAIGEARRAVGSVARPGRKLEPQVVRRRVFGRLQRRGFSGENIRRAVDIALQEHEA